MNDNSRPSLGERIRAMAERERAEFGKVLGGGARRSQIGDKGEQPPSKDGAPVDYDPTWLRPKRVTVHEPHLSLGGGHTFALPVIPHTAMIEVDTRLTWGRILKAIASSEPQIVTVRFPARTVPDDSVNAEERAHWEEFSVLELMRMAHDRQLAVLAVGPMRYVPLSSLSGLAYWRREALTVAMGTEVPDLREGVS